MLGVPKILNLGCGSRFHSAHTNLDFEACAPGIIGWNLKRGIPFPDESFDVVYHSHVLEHFEPDGGEHLLVECYRVLKRGGIIRIVVPDLEMLAEEYLSSVARCRRSEPHAAADHNWMILELCDQMVRSRSGGGMRDSLCAVNLPNRSFIIKRLGSEAEKLLTREPATVSSSRLQRHGLWGVVRLAYFRVAVPIARGILTALLGQRGKISFSEGWFRSSGEVHRQMFDECSLKRALLRTGFTEVVRQDHQRSGITGWNDFGLDAEPSGIPYKPDSLFLEATKP